MPDPVHVERFDPEGASPGDWRHLHAFRLRRHAESAPEEPYEGDALAEVNLRREDPMFIAESAWARWNGEVVGFAELWAPRPGSAGYESQRGILWFDLYVLRDHRRQGVARAMLPWLVEVARRHEGRVLGTGCHEPDGLAAVGQAGFAKKSEARYSHLDLSTLDWAQVESWVEEGRRRSPERSLHFYIDGPPEAEWEEYSSAMTELFNTIPWDDVEHGDFIFTPETVSEQLEHFASAGSTMLRILVREAGGRITGVTEMVLEDGQPEHAHQWLTAVHKAAQGHGIGRWIKCAMLLYVRDNHPAVRWILTDNASSNRYMLKINIELGFQPYKVESNFQVELDRFALWVDSRA